MSECYNSVVSTVFTGMSRAISGIMHFISCWFFDIDIQCNDIVPIHSQRPKLNPRTIWKCDVV